MKGSEGETLECHKMNKQCRQEIPENDSEGFLCRRKHSFDFLCCFMLRLLLVHLRRVRRMLRGVKRREEVRGGLWKEIDGNRRPSRMNGVVFTFFWML
jgi:hypothetical protein